MKEKIEKLKNIIENIKLKLSIIKHKITLHLSQITPIKLFSFMDIEFTASYSWFIGIAVISYLIYKNLFLVLYPKYPPIILTASSIISAFDVISIHRTSRTSPFTSCKKISSRSKRN
jgi:hypothetical protein